MKSMRKVFVYTLGLSLVACGGEEGASSDVEVNTGEQSSLVATTNPDQSSPEVSDNNSENSTEEVNDGKNTTIEYFELKHNFGNVMYPSENKYTFKFKNTGKEPLVIEDAKASCGCTVPNKPEEPIMPGEVGELDVIFRPKQNQVGQPVTKRITVTANTEPKETYLEISANVMEGM